MKYFLLSRVIQSTICIGKTFFISLSLSLPYIPLHTKLPSHTLSLLSFFPFPILFLLIFYLASTTYLWDGIPQGAFCFPFTIHLSHFLPSLSNLLPRHISLYISITLSFSVSLSLSYVVMILKTRTHMQLLSRITLFLKLFLKSVRYLHIGIHLKKKKKNLV